MKQQTAIDYFISKLKGKYNVTPKDTTGGFFNIINEFKEIVEIAKEMEKEQISAAHYDGYYREDMYDTRNYYKDTYGK